MTKAEQALHLQAKKDDASYPSLPRFMKVINAKSRKLSSDKGYRESVIRGFRKRLYNWKRNQLA